MKLYYITDAYINYLSAFDFRIYKNKEARPYVGVVLDVNGYNYYVPLTSPKPKHKTMSNSKDFRKINGGEYGALNFNCMIPVPSNQLSEIDISACLDQQYKRLLQNQIACINRDSENIVKTAKKLYELCLKDDSNITSHDIVIKSRCCNFKMLEEKCSLFSI